MCSHYRARTSISVLVVTTHMQKHIAWPSYMIATCRSCMDIWLKKDIMHASILHKVANALMEVSNCFVQRKLAIGLHCHLCKDCNKLDQRVHGWPFDLKKLVDISNIWKMLVSNFIIIMSPHNGLKLGIEVHGNFLVVRNQGNNLM